MNTLNHQMQALIDTQNQAYRQILTVTEGVQKNLREDIQQLRETLNLDLVLFQKELNSILEEYNEKREKLLEEAYLRIDALNNGKPYNPVNNAEIN